MSFSKAKLKRFNDIDITCGSPSTTGQAATPLGSAVSTTAPSCATSSSSSSTAHLERKEQIEKFFKDAVRFASNNKEAKDAAAANIKESKDKDKDKSKTKGLRLFRTPSLPHRLRFRQNSDVTSASSNSSSNASVVAPTASTLLASAAATPAKDNSKSASHLKGKEALQHEIRSKNELLESYMSQLDVLKRHVDQLKETEVKLREENALLVEKNDSIVKELTNENLARKEINDQLAAENMELAEKYTRLESELKNATDKHAAEITQLAAVHTDLKASNEDLLTESQQQLDNNTKLMKRIESLDEEISDAREKLVASEQKSIETFELLENIKNTNCALVDDVTQLKRQIEVDALAYAQEMKSTNAEMECLKNEKKSLKNDLASKCELIRSLQEEILDKNCDIDSYSDTIRELCREKAQFTQMERSLETAEEKVRIVEVQAEEKLQRLESDLESAIEREKAFWRGELEKRQKLAENEVIKIELEKQDVMVLLESTNDMLRERDEKIQKYEEQIRNGIDYYVQLTDNLQKQVVDLKQDVAKTITEKYNYQLTLSNTRSTVNILMERLRKSDSDVETLKNELESTNLAKSSLEQSYITLQSELQSFKAKLTESEAALSALQESSAKIQQEVSVKETMLNDMLTSEEETLEKFNKIASSFQERINSDVAHYLEMYADLKNKDDARELYMQDMKKALDEFATVLEFAQIELDTKEKSLTKVRDECEQLKLENISLKSQINENSKCIAEKDTDEVQKIEDLQSECEKITSWLLSSSSSEKSVRNESANEINDILKPTTPTNNNKSRCCTTTTTPVRSATKAAATTPRTPRTTPKKTVLFAGKENYHSPQRQNILQTRNK